MQLHAFASKGFRGHEQRKINTVDALTIATCQAGNSNEAKRGWKLDT